MNNYILDVGGVLNFVLVVNEIGVLSPSWDS